MGAGTERPNQETLLRRVGGLRRPAFYATVVALLGLMGVFLGDALVFLFTAWFVRDPGVHHLHDLAMVAMLWTVLVGVVVQLHEPERRTAAMQQALLGTVAITGVNVLTGFFFPPALILGGLLVASVALHPAGRAVLSVRTAGSVSYLLVGLVVLVGIPLAGYAADQYALQSSGDVHAQLGHYADMVTYSVLVVSLGVLAGARPVGWRVPLWSAGGLAAILGVSSVMHPALASSPGSLWGGLAVLWGVGFVVAGEVSHRRNAPGRSR